MELFDPPEESAKLRLLFCGEPLAATTRKLGVSFYAYIKDRIVATNQVPRLDNIIQSRAQELNLGLSWNTS